MLNITKSNIENISQTLIKSRQSWEFSEKFWENSILQITRLQETMTTSRRVTMNFSGQEWFLKIRALQKTLNLHRTTKRLPGENSEILSPYTLKYSKSEI